jgi:hypothetical protein
MARQPLFGSTLNAARNNPVARRRRYVGMIATTSIIWSAPVSTSAAARRNPFAAQRNLDSVRNHYANPSSTILPRALPVSSRTCACLRFAALLVPKCSATVVRILPASTSSATLSRSACCSAMSAVCSLERVNIDSQWIDTHLRINNASSSGSLLISASWPWGAISSTTP